MNRFLSFLRIFKAFFGHLRSKFKIFGSKNQLSNIQKAVAEKYGLVYVELQKHFDKLAKTAENTYWLVDGVHPTYMGHEMIKREWLKAFEQMK